MVSLAQMQQCGTPTPQVRQDPQGAGEGEGMTALEYLRSIEWDRKYLDCRLCGRPKHLGHTPKCSLSAAIADAEELEKRRGLRTRAEVKAKLHNGNPNVTYDGALRWVLGEE